MTSFLLAGLFCLLVGIQVQLIEEFSEATGLGTDADPVTQSDLSLDLAVLSETTTIPPPEDFNFGVAENGTLLV